MLKRQNNQQSTKGKIIQVAMDIIASEGFQGVTTRKIAAGAGVNVAAINYHFGSKDALVTEALRYLTLQLKDTFNVLKDEAFAPEERLNAFFKSYIKVICEYPDIIKNMISHTMQEHPLDGHAEYALFIQSEGVALINSTIRQLRPDLDEDSCSLKTITLISGLSMPFVMGKPIKALLDVDLLSDTIQEKFVGLLLESIKKS